MSTLTVRDLGTKVPRIVQLPVPFVKLGTECGTVTFLKTGDEQEVEREHALAMVKHAPESFQLFESVKQDTSQSPASEPEPEPAVVAKPPRRYAKATA